MDVLLESLHSYYSVEKNMNKLLDVVEVNNKISLRIIDWFVTNYSKKYKVYYNLNTENFIVYLDYKSQLKAFTKKQFDPFCRRERIEFKFNNKDKIITTIGQLNFFKWAIENMITEYILIHYKDIEEDMNICYNNNKKLKKSNERKPRQELSKSASRGLNSSSHKIKLDFN